MIKPHLAPLTAAILLSSMASTTTLAEPIAAGATAGLPGQTGMQFTSDEDKGCTSQAESDEFLRSGLAFDSSLGPIGQAPSGQDDAALTEFLATLPTTASLGGVVGGGAGAASSTGSVDGCGPDGTITTASSNVPRLIRLPDVSVDVGQVSLTDGIKVNSLVSGTVDGTLAGASVPGINAGVLEGTDADPGLAIGSDDGTGVGSLVNASTDQGSELAGASVPTIDANVVEGAGIDSDGNVGIDSLANASTEQGSELAGLDVPQLDADVVKDTGLNDGNLESTLVDVDYEGSDVLTVGGSSADVGDGGELGVVNDTLASGYSEFSGGVQDNVTDPIVENTGVESFQLVDADLINNELTAEVVYMSGEDADTFAAIQDQSQNLGPIMEGDTAQDLSLVTVESDTLNSGDLDLHTAVFDAEALGLDDDFALLGQSDDGLETVYDGANDALIDPVLDGLADGSDLLDGGMLDGIGDTIESDVIEAVDDSTLETVLDEVVGDDGLLDPIDLGLP